MVEVSGPRRAEAQPVVTFTVELSQSDIELDALEAASAAPLPPAPAPAPAPASPTPTHLDTPWFAEDIERLPEANVDRELPQQAAAAHSQRK